MSAIDRGDVRTALATALTSAIPGAKTVLRYLGDPGKLMPAITIASRGSSGSSNNIGYTAVGHRFVIHVLVLAGTGSATWTEENSEDLLDDTRAAFDTFMETGTLTVSGKVHNLQRDGDSVIERVLISGEQYLDESIPIIVRTF